MTADGVVFAAVAVAATGMCIRLMWVLRRQGRELTWWQDQAGAEQRRGDRLLVKANGWRAYALSLAQRNDYEVIRRNTDHWMSAEGTALLRQRFAAIVSRIGES